MLSTSMRALVGLGVLALMACHHAPPAVSPVESPALAQMADQQAHTASPTGQAFGDALHGVALGPDATSDWQVPLRAGLCYSFGYAADPGLARFGFYLWDPTNHRAATARGVVGSGVSRYCAATNGMYHAQGKSLEGAGHFAVVIYAEQGAPPPPQVVVAPPVTDLAAIIEKQASAAAPGAARLGEYFDGTADTSDWVTAMQGGKCYWIIGAGQPDTVKKLWLYLWDPRSSRITESRSDSSTAMVGYCALETGMFKFQAKRESGSGPYKVGIFVR